MGRPPRRYRNRQTDPPPFPFVWVPPEHRLAKTSRRVRLRPLVWIALILAFLAWVYWPASRQYEPVDIGDAWEWLPY